MTDSFPERDGLPRAAAHPSIDPNSIAIIGAGIAGLAAGCYAQMNGYRTTIFEMHDKPGGLCTAWTRHGYTFDGCIHWLVGSNPASSYHQLWAELGALPGPCIVDHAEFGRVEGAAGKTLIVYTDADRLEQHLLELAPEDSVRIEELCRLIRLAARLDWPLGEPAELAGWVNRVWSGVRLARYLPLLRWGRLTVQEYAARWRSPVLAAALPLVFDLPDFPVLGMLMTLGWMHARNAGYPIGGSLAFARSIERRYLELGGQIRYGARVAKILVEAGQAVGLRLADGEEIRAGRVVSAADGYTTLFRLLGGRYLDDRLRLQYALLPLFPAYLQVSFGVARELAAEPHLVSFALDAPITLGRRSYKRLVVQHYGFDPTLAPAGKSVLVVRAAADGDEWEQLAADAPAYAAAKAQVAETVLAVLARRYPGLAQQVEVLDVATPHTTIRYTGNWRGSIEGWLLTPKTLGMTMRKTLPGLNNFHMVGQWVEPGGGLPSAAQSGRAVVQVLCRQDAKHFTTCLPAGPVTARGAGEVAMV